MAATADAVNHLMNVIVARNQTIEELRAENATVKAHNVALTANQLDETDKAAIQNANSVG